MQNPIRSLALSFLATTCIVLMTLAFALPLSAFAASSGDGGKAIGDGVTNASSGESSSDAANDADSDSDSLEPEPILFRELAEKFRPHCVGVLIHAKSYEGKNPPVGEFGENVKQERSTPVGGYWWDNTHVIIPDQILQDQYINSIEVQAPGSDTLYPARIAGRFIKLQAVLLEVLPNAAGKTPESAPLEFIEGDVDEAISLAYLWENGAWRIRSGTPLGKSFLADDGVETVQLDTKGVIVDTEGNILGLAFSDSGLVGDDGEYWYGREVSYTPLWTTESGREQRERLETQLSEGILDACFSLRIKIDDDDEDETDWTVDVEDEQVRRGSPEIHAPALVVGKRLLLVPLSLPADGIAKIEDITVTTHDNRVLPAEFAGAFRDYLAVLIEVKEDLPTGNLPAGFTRLNPYGPSGTSDGKSAASVPTPYLEYIQRWQIDYNLGRRRELADYDRWLGTFRGYRGDTVVSTMTNEQDGALAFDTEGNLVAVAMTPRLLNTRGRDELVGNDRARGTPGFRPLAFLAEKLAGASAIDPSLIPVDEDQGQRLIDLGIEFQPLDTNTARLFHATRETRGGKIGLLVTYVYPGTMAAKIGLQEHDILLRLFVDGKREPMELRSSGYALGGYDPGDMSSDSFQSIMQYLPPPWPNRENVITTLLTGAGVGRKVRLDYVREGVEKTATFETSYFEPDYRSAKKEKFAVLGLTVKPITYEVARFFGRGSDLSGVIISQVEPGGKASVAGLHRYQLITQVNGVPVKGVKDFRERMDSFEKGQANSVELTAEGFGKTRLVKIE